MARKRNQCSHLGEILDHGFDSINIEIVSASLLFSIGAPRLLFGLAMLFSSLVYNCQIVLYRAMNKMVDPPTNGVEAESSLIIVHLLIPFIYTYLPWSMAYIPLIASVPGLFLQLQDWWFFFRTLKNYSGKEVSIHLYFIIAGLPLAALYIAGFMRDSVFVLVYGLLCLRCTGSVVLVTVSEKVRKISNHQSNVFNGFFVWIFCWEIVLVTLAVLNQYGMFDIVTALFIMHLLVLMAYDFQAHYQHIK